MYQTVAMSTTATSSTVVMSSTYTEESPTPKKSCLRMTIRSLQLGFLFVIPIFAVSLIMFMAVMAVRCDGSGGFIMGRDGSVHCSSSIEEQTTSGRETQVPSVSRLGPDMSNNGTVVMTVTRVVLISVSVLIFSFTAWICVWYQRYGKGGGESTDTVPDPVAATTSAQPPLDMVLTIRVNDYLAKEDMERLLGPDHSAAPAV